MRALVKFIKKEIVLWIALALAVLSMFVVKPDSRYLGYVDFRTLAILFCLMAVVAGFKRQGVFELLAEKLLSVAGSVRGMVTVLVLLCFFMSMVITNDVALITFVPFTIAVMGRAEAGIKERWLLRTVVMQTIAANLGSMLTPIGNPQNLYLFGLSGLGVGAFVWLMLPYTLLSLLLLLGWIFCASRRDDGKINKAAGSEGTEPEEKRGSGGAERMIAYGVLAVISLLAVGHIIPYWATFAFVLAYTLCRDRKVLSQVDYALLCTFAALFVLIGNIGRIPAFRDFLMRMTEGREIAVSVAASQIMSNVPAAILLSGFTNRIEGLIVGTNLGGLGTMIASMASLISFKYIAAAGERRGRYFLLFTAANLVFLAVLSAAAYLMR